MAQFTIFLPDGSKFRAEAGSSSEIWDALKAQGMVDPEQGAIIRNNDTRTETYASAKYSTSDPERVNMIRDERMNAGEASTASWQEQALADRPVLTRGAAAMQGVPFAGEYFDEAVGAVYGPEARDAVRMSQEAAMARRPAQTLASQFATGAVATAPLALAAAPLKGMSLGNAVLTGAGIGAVGGGIEGAVSGYGAGETPDERVLNAQQRAMIGAGFGAALPAIGPVLGAGFGRLRSMVGPERAINRAARELGVSPEAARLAGTTSQFEEAIPTPTRATSLAEASPAQRTALDVAAMTPTAGRTEAQRLVNEQARSASLDLNAALDETLGAPRGYKTQQADLMRQTADERAGLYADAYGVDLTERALRNDAATAASEELQSILGRVDRSVIEDANRLMTREGFGDDIISDVVRGNIPSVRQIDYIRRALSSRARTMGASPEDVSTFTSLASDINKSLDELAPEYNAARSRAAEIIGDREALDVGYDALKQTMTREDVSTAVSNMTEGELGNVRSTMRQYIDDVVARASSPLDPEAAEYKEALTALRNLSKRETQDKMRIILGDEAANALIERIRQNVDPIAVRSQFLANSATAPRQAAKEAADQIIGTPSDMVSAPRELASGLLNAGAMTANELKAQAYGDVAPLLARQMPPQEFDVTQQLLRGIPSLEQRSKDLLRGGITGGLVTGLRGVPAATNLARAAGYAPQDQRGTLRR